MSTDERREMANPVVHFEVVGKDAEALRKFYGEAFGWKLQDVMEGAYYMVDTGGDGAIPGGIGAAPDGGSGHVMFYVQVDDPAAALEKIKSLGGSTVSEPMDVPEGPTIAHFADPEGHVVGLVKGM
jgi:uncharacterized protein